MPNLVITNILITDASLDEEGEGTYINENGQREYRVPNIGIKEHTAKIRINYTCEWKFK